ncbi:MAG: Hsp70 family protein, partial [Nocardia sp.]|nr:Hsp70 family protein [Nocardia sp.]
MTVGLGVSIGTVNTVCAVDTPECGKPARGRRRGAAGENSGRGKRNSSPRQQQPQQRSTPGTWRTTLTFDSAGGARVGRIPKHGRAVTDFADLTESARSARVGQRCLAPADLVATVARTVVADVSAHRVAADPDDRRSAVVVTHPVTYPSARVRELRAALDETGLSHAALIAEPVAAAAWLSHTHGPLLPGLALVYDLGGSGLTVTLVRIGQISQARPIIGEPLRSNEFGGRAFGANLVGRGELRSGESGSDAMITGMRTAHVRKSLEVVYACLRRAAVTMADIDCVLVVGGAARPPEVAEVIERTLSRPVVVAADPERTIAEGAAILARYAAEGSTRTDAPQTAAKSARYLSTASRPGDKLSRKAAKAARAAARAAEESPRHAATSTRQAAKQEKRTAKQERRAVKDQRRAAKLARRTGRWDRRGPSTSAAEPAQVRETTSPEAAPAQATPPEAVSAEALSAEAVSAEALSAEALSAEAVSAEAVPADTASPETAFAATTSATAASARTASTHTASAETPPAEPLSATAAAPESEAAATSAGVETAAGAPPEPDPDTAEPLVAASADESAGGESAPDSTTPSSPGAPFRPRIGMAPQHPRTSLPEVPIEPDAHIAARTSAVSASTVLLDPIGHSEPFAVLESAAFLGSLEGLGSLQDGRRASVSLESGQRAAVAVAERAAVPLDSMPEASASVTA